MSDCAVCYVADINFVLPALISAIRWRRFVPLHRAYIYLFIVDDDSEQIARIAAFAQAHDIRVVQLDSRLFEGIDWSRAHVTHIPVAALGRFFIDDLLPNACQRIIYLDGDTWIRRNPSALVDYKVPDGRLAAVEDISFFCSQDMTPHGRFVRSYFEGLGLDPGGGYFNSGVIAVGRRAWREISKDCLQFFAMNIERCKYHDQSALNAVTRDRRVRLSPVWNFQTPYRYWDLEPEIDPVVYHFTQGPKPWTGPVEPWSELFPLYNREIATLSRLNLPIKHLSTTEIVGINAMARKQQQRIRYIFPFRLMARRRRLRELAVTSHLSLAA